MTEDRSRLNSREPLSRTTVLELTLLCGLALLVVVLPVDLARSRRPHDAAVAATQLALVGLGLMGGLWLTLRA